MRVYLFTIGLVYSIICNSQTLKFSVSNNKFGIDETLSIIVSRIQDIENYQDIKSYNEIVITLGDSDYSFISKPNSLEYSNAYIVQNTNSLNQYSLYFTELPIISIASDNEIVDEPKVLATLIYTDNEQTITSNIGIEVRGGFSQNYPKKTYDLEFWKDETGNETRDFQFGELRKDDDWILDALYNEPLRLRSYTASKLWGEIHAPYHIDDESEAKSGADLMYVEMFLNGLYNGIYNLSEQVDRKQLKLKKYNGNMRGELYKGADWGGAVTFTGLPSYKNDVRIWSGYKFKYPDEDEITNWDKLYQFTNFVMNSSESDFESDIWSLFSEDNFIDYFLFLNLIRATDNTGKNVYVAKYKADEPYFYVPWDLDGCLGTNWEGKNSNITDDILTNGFINRVIQENPKNTFNTASSRWFDYRDDIFSDDSLSNTISQQYSYFQTNKIYERESLVYSNYSFDNPSLTYTLNWLENRLAYLDVYFGNVLPVNSISKSNNLNIYPNPAKDKIYLAYLGELVDENYKIYNNLGQLIQSGIVTNKQILLEKLERGIYFLSINSVSFKLIKN